MPPGNSLEYITKKVSERWIEFSIQSPFMEEFIIWTSKPFKQDPQEFLELKKKKKAYSVALDGNLGKSVGKSEVGFSCLFLSLIKTLTFQQALPGNVKTHSRSLEISPCNCFVLEEEAHHPSECSWRSTQRGKVKKKKFF